MYLVFCGYSSCIWVSKVESVSDEVELKSAKFRTFEIGSIRQIGDTSFRFEWFHPLLCWYKNLRTWEK